MNYRYGSVVEIRVDGNILSGEIVETSDDTDSLAHNEYTIATGNVHWYDGLTWPCAVTASQIEVVVDE